MDLHMEEQIVFEYGTGGEAVLSWLWGLKAFEDNEGGEDRTFLVLFAAREYVIAIACRHNQCLKLSLQMGEKAPHE